MCYPWLGSETERRLNRLTHRFTGGQDARCWQCDCRPGHYAADWPCGTEPHAGIPSVGYDLIDSMAEAAEREPGGID